MIILGLTGMTGAGKGTVGSIFSSLGAYVADTDRIYHGLLSENLDLKSELCQSFGDILDENGAVCRKKLAKIVFADKEKLNRLNEVTHSYVLAQTKRMLEYGEKLGHTVGVIDAPLLFESGADKWCSAVIGVIASRDICIARIIKRDGIDAAAAQMRADSQKSDKWFREHCDFIIENNGTREELYEKARDVFYCTKILRRCENE